MLVEKILFIYEFTLVKAAISKTVFCQHPEIDLKYHHQYTLQNLPLKNFYKSVFRFPVIKLTIAISNYIPS